MSSIRKFILPFFLFLCVFALYAHNLSRATYGGDVGDLLAASAVMGVAHPPGYPLFTMLGFILSRIHLITPAFMIGLISAVSGALGIFFFYLFSYKFTNSKLISLISALVLAFSYFYWFYSEIAEAFALNGFFAIVLFLTVAFYFLSKKKRYLYLLAFVAGLSLTNHQTIVLLFPSLLLLSLPNLLKDKHKVKTILSCVGLFILGLLPYVYVPLAASHNPLVNWDNVHDLKSFLHLVLRQDYGTFTIGSIGGSSFAQRLVLLKIYLSGVIIQATIPVIAIIILGMVYVFRKYKLVFWSLILGFILAGPVFIFYSGFSIINSFLYGVYERFVVLSFIVLLMFLPFGLLFLSDLFKKFFSRQLVYLILSVFLIVPLMLFRYNFPKTDLSNLALGEKVVQDTFLPMPKNSIVLLDGDTVLFNTWYMQYAKHFRADVAVINSNGPATSNSFYQTQAKLYYKLHPKEKQVGTDVNVLGQISKSRDVFSSIKYTVEKNSGYQWIPVGLLYKLVSKQNLPSESLYIKKTNEVWSKMHLPIGPRTLPEGSLTIADVYGYYAQGLLRTGEYFADNYKDNNLALDFYNRAALLDPGNYSVYQALGVYYIQNGNCSLAKDNFQQAVDIAPYQNLVYFLLYYDYQDCLKQPQKAQQVVLDYQRNFQTDFFQDLKKIGDIK